jgi:hypothetical protein
MDEVDQEIVELQESLLKDEKNLSKIKVTEERINKNLLLDDSMNITVEKIYENGETQEERIIPALCPDLPMEKL